MIGYLGKNWKRSTWKLSNMIWSRIIKNTYVELKLLLNTDVLSKTYIVMKYTSRNYRHDNLQVIFHIVRLISDCLQNSYCQAIFTKKMLSPKSNAHFFPHENRQ